MGKVFEMNTITDRLIELDNREFDGQHNLTLHDEGEWSGNITPFSAFNDAGVECEVGEFLYSWVRILKPTHILETGTHWGIGASYMGIACKDNGFGNVDTLEFLPENYQIADRRFKRLGLTGQVHNYLKDVAKHEPFHQYQFMLLDTEPQTRFAELVRFYDYLDEGGFVFIHDLHRHMHQIPNAEHGFAWPYGQIPHPIKEWVKWGKLRPFHFSTPRGLTGFYKPAGNDYKWE
jgi:predicted O-methyltransferase YrrM